MAATPIRETAGSRATEPTNYRRWRERLLSDPAERELYEQEAAEDLSLHLVMARQAAGLSQAEVARRMGTSQPHVARIESAGYAGASIGTLMRYAEAVGKTLVIGLR